MLLDKNKINLLINNISLGLGLALLIIGIFFLKQPIKDNTQVVRSNLDISSLELEYNRLSSVVDEEVIINIPNGSSGLTVANILEDKGIMSAVEFIKYLDLFNIENKIKAGQYKFNNQDTSADILNRISIKK